MKLKIVWIGTGKTKNPAIQSLTEEYLKRISRYVSVEGQSIRDEDALLALCGCQTLTTSSRSPSTSIKQRRSTADRRSTLMLLDSQGKEFTSEEFAKFIEDYRDRNPLPLVFAIGPADGFSATARDAAQFTFSLGKITLAHELARVVLLEQIYRAFTILDGHPYHTGH